MNSKTSLNAEELKAFEPAEKIGIIACVNPDGLPHISMITSIRAIGPTQLTLGEFCRGLSKEYIRKNPRIAFLILTPKRKMWRGKAKWTHLKKDGPEYELYNAMPMFRYNPYFGVNTVHYLDLIETSDAEDLPKLDIARAAVATRVAKGGAKTKMKGRILKPYAEKLFNKMDSLKFLAYIDEDGFPLIIPIIQCQAADSRRLVFSPAAYGDELGAITEGASVAVFALTMRMESVLIRGVFLGVSRYRFVRLGVIDIAWIYNSMIPCHGQIYPEVPLRPVVNF